MANGQPEATTPNGLLLKDFRPQSIFNIPGPRVEKARYRAIDFHSHNYAQSDEAVARWVRTMDEVGVESAIILSGATGNRFDEVFGPYFNHYHWPLYGIGLEDEVLRRIYRENALEILLR